MLGGILGANQDNLKPVLEQLRMNLDKVIEMLGLQEPELTTVVDRIDALLNGDSLDLGAFWELRNFLESIANKHSYLKKNPFLDIILESISAFIYLHFAIIDLPNRDRLFARLENALTSLSVQFNHNQNNDLEVFLNDSIAIFTGKTIYEHMPDDNDNNEEFYD